jgi:hypothetical protein
VQEKATAASNEADGVDDARVLDVAQKVVDRVNGIGRLQNASFRPVAFADSYEDDSVVTVHPPIAQLVVRSVMTVTAEVRDANGNIVPQPPPPGPGRLSKASTSADVAEEFAQQEV